MRPIPNNGVRVTWYVDLELSDLQPGPMFGEGQKSELARHGAVLCAANIASDMMTDPGTTATFWEVDIPGLPTAVVDLDDSSVEFLYNVTPDDAVQVKREDANNYCIILRLLGMEEEGDPVAAVKRLLAAEAKPPANFIEVDAPMSGYVVLDRNKEVSSTETDTYSEARQWADYRDIDGGDSAPHAVAIALYREPHK